MPEDTLARELHDRGMRLTPQRELVLRAVREMVHSTPEQIADRVRGQGASMSLTTVYRALDLLESLGLVRHAHIGPGPSTYHAAEDTDHVHTRCQRCGEVGSMPVALLDDVAAALLRERGFRLDPNHVALSGLCAACGSAPATGASAGQEFQ